MSKQPLPETMNWPKDAIFTVGHSTLKLEVFIALLEAYDLECLADIRTVPPAPANRHALSMSTPASRSIQSGLALIQTGRGPPVSTWTSNC